MGLHQIRRNVLLQPKKQKICGVTVSPKDFAHADANVGGLGMQTLQESTAFGLLFCKTYSSNQINFDKQHFQKID